MDKKPNHLITTKNQIMATTKKDLRVYLSESERIAIQEIVTQLASVETILAHNPDLVPLDVFLDFSTYVHKWFTFYSIDLYHLKPISLAKYQNMLQDLREWFILMKKNTAHINNSPTVLLTKAMQKAMNLNITFTVGSTVPPKK